MDALIGYTGFVGSTLHEQLGDQALALYNKIRTYNLFTWWD